MAVDVLLVAGLLLSTSAGAQPVFTPAPALAPPPSTPDFKRTDLQRHDLGAPGLEVVQVRVDLPAGLASPGHRHPGEEIVYTIEGRLEYRLEGRPPVTLGAGEVLFIPAGVRHVVRNVGDGNAAELATYVVWKGKPLIVLDE